MNATPTIELVTVVGSSLCVASDDGKLAHLKIYKAFQERGSATLSFRDVERLTTAFLNAAVGQLYGEFNSAQLDNNLRFVEIAPEHRKLIAKVVERAKSYFSQKDLIDQQLESERAGNDKD